MGAPERLLVLLENNADDDTQQYIPITEGELAAIDNDTGETQEAFRIVEKKTMPTSNAVLIVEDETDINFMYRFMLGFSDKRLASNGNEIDSTTSNKGFVDYMQEHNPSVAILDVNLGPTTSVEGLEELFQTGRLEETSTVFIVNSAKPENDDVVNAFIQGHPELASRFVFPRINGERLVGKLMQDQIPQFLSQYIDKHFANKEVASV